MGLLSVKLRFYWPNHRRHDIDNIKTLLDSMSGILWDDDSQVKHLETWVDVNKEDPRLEMEVDDFTPA